MRNPIAIVATIIAAVALAACSTSGSDPSVSLPGTDWTVISIAGSETIPDAQPTIAFGTDGTLSGNASCNQYNGPYTVDGDKLTIGPNLATTLMLCEGGVGDQEQAFILALTGATNWSILGSGDLEIKGASTIVARPGAGGDGASSGGELSGTSWILAGLPGTELGANAPTIEFGADGTASGFSGCNNFNGSYTVDGSSITFGPLAGTKMACPNVDMAVETAFLTALQGATSWSIEAERLTIDGAGTLEFTPA